MNTHPDLILHNGRFTTLDRSNPVASAVAIKDGTLPRGRPRCGGRAARRARDATVIDLGGRAPCPA